ncbi:hypothetical protein [Sigmofec virus UA08Rod_4258]|uniref:Uncharacterized protein n=1 Tax=Sigmofec virus UA08Rod_4258 TaxID=2929397 RepID=A0A976R729_9VIRU|nr:hypothetical protein [Sigmofec virus UA08Rod_4258]
MHHPPSVADSTIVVSEANELNAVGEAEACDRALKQPPPRGRAVARNVSSTRAWLHQPAYIPLSYYVKVTHCTPVTFGNSRFIFFRLFFVNLC